LAIKVLLAFASAAETRRPVAKTQQEQLFYQARRAPSSLFSFVLHTLSFHQHPSFYIPFYLNLHHTNAKFTLQHSDNPHPTPHTPTHIMSYGGGGYGGSRGGGGGGYSGGYDNSRSYGQSSYGDYSTSRSYDGYDS